MVFSKKISKQLGGKVLTVVVGEGDRKREFVVHEELICESSEFFRGAMSGEWKEAGNRVVRLPEEDPDVFALYLQAIYNGHVQLDELDQHYNIIAWASVYTLADKLMDVDIKNIVVGKFYEIRSELWYTCITTSEAVQIIYDQTPGSCGMRQLFVDAAVYHYGLPRLDKTDFSSAMDSAPREFLQDLALATVSKKAEIVCLPPKCACPDTAVFSDYLENYLESKQTAMEHAQAEGNEEVHIGKNAKKKEKINRKDDECSHGNCCRCGKAWGGGSNSTDVTYENSLRDDHVPSGTWGSHIPLGTWGSG